MAISTVIALARGNPANSSGADLAASVNALISGRPVVAQDEGITTAAADNTAALVALAATANGRQIYFPSGTYKFASAGVISNLPLNLRGDPGGTVFDFSDGGSLDITSAPVAIPNLSANLVGGDIECYLLRRL